MAPPAFHKGGGRITREGCGIPSVPVFALARFRFFDGAGTPFVKIGGGHRFAWLDDCQGGRFNPYVYHVIPSAEDRFAVGRHSLGLEVGAEYMGFKTSHDPEGDGVRFNVSARNFNGGYFAVSYDF